MSAQLFVMMGVSGSGKTTIGQLLAQRLSIEFLDADDYHSQANKDKMHAGVPLTDEDRWPWLATLNGLLLARKDRGCVLACSALKEVYRNLLLKDIPAEELDFVLLEGSKDMIANRMTHRQHFMPASMLDSQLATLEVPSYAIKVTNDRDPSAVVDEILRREHVQAPAPATNTPAPATDAPAPAADAPAPATTEGN